jgi:16S rRNA (uracil1498-N3)-methyltransferase
MSFSEACQYAKDMDLLLLPYENAEDMETSKNAIHKAREHNRIGVFIGPEGGFDSKEVEQLQSIGSEVISLGHRILRTETAALVAMSILQSSFGDI